MLGEWMLGEWMLGEWMLGEWMHQLKIGSGWPSVIGKGRPKGSSSLDWVEIPSALKIVACRSFGLHPSKSGALPILSLLP
jgi:hypothetical protein